MSIIENTKKYFKEKQARQEQIEKIADLLAQLAWLETQDAVITIRDGRIHVGLYGIVDKKRVHFCEGQAEDNFADAIKEAAKIRRAQEAL